MTNTSPESDGRIRLRISFFMIAVVSLLVSMVLGLQRTGFGFPLPVAVDPTLHGPLIVGAFFGTIIGVERAMAIGRNWAWMAPGLLAVSLPVSVFSNVHDGLFMLAWGSAVLMVASFRMAARLGTLAALITGLGALAFAVANISLFTGTPMPAVVPLWGTFLMLTIAGARLTRLDKMAVDNVGEIRIKLVTVMTLGGGIMALLGFDSGEMLVGAGAIFFFNWSLRYDTVFSAFSGEGAPRFAAIAHGTGTVWLMVAGIAWMWFGGVSEGLVYDAILHALFVGFVFSVIFGRILGILATSFNTTAPYTKMLYIPLVILHAGVLGRVGGGFAGVAVARQHSSMLNAVAITLFVVMVVVVLVRRR